MKEANFRCNYCGHLFVHEDRFLKHRCKQIIRREEMETIVGQTAWFLYQAWMRLQHRQIPTMKAFLTSKYYQQFIKFAKFAKQVRLPDANLYINQMVVLDLQPMLWTHDQVYGAFLEHMDKKISANQHAQITINTLFDFADSLRCETSEIFQNIDPNECIQLIRQRKLSPWILLNSKKFFAFLQKLTIEQRIILDTIIRPKYWAEKLANNVELVKQMKIFVEELGL